MHFPGSAEISPREENLLKGIGWLVSDVREALGGPDWRDANNQINKMVSTGIGKPEICTHKVPIIIASFIHVHVLFFVYAG